ncbi:SOS response regulatory protein OraA/RecX, interacts with RecA [Alkalispirochaeta americana]|uniref:Regulatory protein RecX n=1 Tax=Alkalispirochaeta americana TaxID=159291 RepID=A0A1N6N430_9SPIO|nr:regulatory protein RecX [Alkalispirochaeta americana]SIP86840.1 SOS response regulatory protein OraA/RecX, interacts with RecA [Alkalispirochaeta americana]
MRAVASSSPSVKHYPPDTPVVIKRIRPHANIAAGVSVFAALSLNPSPSAEQNRSKPLIRLIRFDIARDVISRHTGQPVQEGLSLEIDLLRDLAFRSGFLFAPAVAVDLLARRDHSQAELRRKLSARGFSQDAVETALRKVRDASWQSDLRFASSWVRSRMSGRGTSRRALLAGLASRGVDRETAAAALEEYEEENPECFRRSLQLTYERLAGQNKETIIRKLLRKGFEVVEINKIVR